MDWATTPEDVGGLGLERKAAWQLLYATKNAVKHARNPAELTKVDPAAMAYILIAAMINRIRLGALPEGSMRDAARLLMDIWHQRPDWVEAETQKWKRSGV